jgi:transcriptional regulator with XRE-family HTH domain
MRKHPDYQPTEKDFLVAYHIKILRKRHFPGQASAQQCANKLGIPLSQFYSWENGSRIPRRKNLEKIRECFGVPREYFAQKPEKWKHIYAKMLEMWNIRVEKATSEIFADDETTSSLPTPQLTMASQEEMNAPPTQPSQQVATSQTEADTLPTPQQAMTSQEEVNAIFRLLVEKQMMVEKGEIDPKKFNEQMRDLHKYMKWSFSQ